MKIRYKKIYGIFLAFLVATGCLADSKAGNEAQSVASVTVVPAAKAAIVFSSAQFYLTQNQAIPAIIPGLTGATPVLCGATPPLPAGLTIDPATCVISGTPTTLQALTTYSIAFSDQGQNVATSVGIAVEKAAGTLTAISLAGNTLNMIYIPSKTAYNGPTDARQAAAGGFEIAISEVSYKFWSDVYTWATRGTGSTGAGLYVFSNPGHQGGDAAGCAAGAVGNTQNPVTCLNWRDAMVWANALTEFYNSLNATPLAVVYTSDAAYTIPIRNSADGIYAASVSYPVAGTFDNPYVNPAANGYRLASSTEWELAGRYINDSNLDGDILDPGEYYPGNYAVGATASYLDFTATSAVAWFGNIVLAGTGNTVKTHPIVTAGSSATGLFDMSGNVAEWVFDWTPRCVGSARSARGGSWMSQATDMQLGLETGMAPYVETVTIGFRVARTP